MKIKIIKNEGIYNDQMVVSFSSEFGDGKASWNGENPVEGREYYVELEIPDTVEWRKDVSKSDKKQYCIKNNGDSTIIVCEVETFFEYGCCNFRIGTSIVTLEIVGELYPKGTFVEISTENLILYDTNL
ncbi:hypothetical protein A374_18970 [Fictibacillus macauensis ZFHKF-1]|uniref:Uncharacterized protein n=1 Tax=Fictibacillus macauensis ZFHKF-1 TaxID=1196324 RepID=I8ADS8_9BACL|nr:hypothetical protein [Fictibacillus macauensis]EIT83732.1 hypothetical protein A374_18970 [Fictibacillus macauensis ZFHKF-1]